MQIRIKLNTIDNVEILGVLANQVDDDVTLIQGDMIANAKSTMMIFSLNLLEPMILLSDDTKHQLSDSEFIKKLIIKED